MIAHFYLMAESFAKNVELPNEVIEDKVKRLSEDVVLIHQYKDTNKLYTNYDDIYPQVLYKTYTIEDFICKAHELKQKGVDRDVINSLRNIICDFSEETTKTSAQVIDVLLSQNNEENCHGIIAFHEVCNIDINYQIIYGIDGWYKFRRYFLSQYPKNVDFFLAECEKYFPKLFFHSENKTSICEIFPYFAKSIIKHLGYLNDVFYTYRERKFINETDKYKTFSIECQLEEYAAPKDNNSSKTKLSFNFSNDDKNYTTVICYPHLRLCKSDNLGDSHYYQNRIYFHEGLSNIKEGKILIGHIGEHL